MSGNGEPVHVSVALSELIQRRGYARLRGQAQLRSIWSEVAGAQVASQTRAVAINRGALLVEVASSALLSELSAFQSANLLRELRRRHPDMKIKDLKFRLNSGIGGG